MPALIHIKINIQECSQRVSQRQFQLNLSQSPVHHSIRVDKYSVTPNKFVGAWPDDDSNCHGVPRRQFSVSLYAFADGGLHPKLSPNQLACDRLLGRIYLGILFMKPINMRGHWRRCRLPFAFEEDTFQAKFHIAFLFPDFGTHLEQTVGCSNVRYERRVATSHQDMFRIMAYYFKVICNLSSHGIVGGSQGRNVPKLVCCFWSSILLLEISSLESVTCCQRVMISRFDSSAGTLLRRNPWLFAERTKTTPYPSAELGCESSLMLQ